MYVDEVVSLLTEGARTLARTSTPANVFKALLDASRAAVPRASVLLLRQGSLMGWGSVGYSTDRATAQRSFRTAANAGWLGEIVGSAGARVCTRPATVHEPDFGQERAADAVGCALCIDGKPVALLVGERGDDESPWFPDGLALIASIAEARLELGLARRRAGGSPQAGASASDRPEAAAAGAAVADEAPPPPAAPSLDAARRYARLVATDIRLYNEEAVMLGRRNRDLTDRLGEHLARGKETFMRRHGDLGETAIELLHEAYVQVLAAGDAALIPAGRLVP